MERVDEFRVLCYSVLSDLQFALRQTRQIDEVTMEELILSANTLLRVEAGGSGFIGAFLDSMHRHIDRWSKNWKCEEDALPVADVLFPFIWDYIIFNRLSLSELSPAYLPNIMGFAFSFLCVLGKVKDMHYRLFFEKYTLPTIIPYLKVVLTKQAEEEAERARLGASNTQRLTWTSLYIGVVEFLKAIAVPIFAKRPIVFQHDFLTLFLPLFQGQGSDTHGYEGTMDPYENCAAFIWNLADNAPADVKEEIVRFGIIPILTRNFSRSKYRAALQALSFGDEVVHETLHAHNVPHLCRNYLVDHPDDKNANFLLINLTDESDVINISIPDQTIEFLVDIIGRMAAHDRLFPEIVEIHELLSPLEILYPLEKLLVSSQNNRERMMDKDSTMKSLLTIFNHPLLSFPDRLKMVRILKALCRYLPDHPKTNEPDFPAELRKSLLDCQDSYHFFQASLFLARKETKKTILPRLAVKLIGEYFYASVGK